MIFCSRPICRLQIGKKIKEKACLNIIEDCPTYFIEREIGVRIEAHTRAMQESDLRDMQSFCTVMAYADIATAENLFSNLALQAKLYKKYDTQIVP